MLQGILIGIQYTIDTSTVRVIWVTIESKFMGSISIRRVKLCSKAKGWKLLVTTKWETIRTSLTNTHSLTILLCRISRKTSRITDERWYYQKQLSGPVEQKKKEKTPVSSSKALTRFIFYSIGSFIYYYRIGIGREMVY